MGITSVFFVMAASARQVADSRATEVYHQAMDESSDLIHKIKAAAETPEPARAVVCQVWANSGDVPYLARMFEFGQELQTPKALPE